MIGLLGKLQRLLGIATLLLLPEIAWAAAFEVDPEQSVFSMVTHKEGIAAQLAHEHLIFPATYTVHVDMSDDTALNEDVLQSAQFDLRFLAKDLVADDPMAKQRWIDGIRKLKILNKPFPEVSEKDRKQIRTTMLSHEQLDAEAFPEISVRTVGIEPRTGESLSRSEAYNVQLEMTVHGNTVTKPCVASISLQGDTLKVEATGRFKFTDFGIKPYSAFLGAIRNQDKFDLYVNFTATRHGS